MEKISRKGFLKIAAAAAMSGVTAGALAACNSASSSTASGAAGQYIPGTYEGTAEGISSTVKVTMTFSDSAVTDVVVDTSGETASFGAAAADELREQLMAAGAAEIDGVSGATYTSTAVKEAAANCIQRAMGVAAEAPAEAPAAEVQRSFPACEENLGGAAAAGHGLRLRSGAAAGSAELQAGIAGRCERGGNLSHRQLPAVVRARCRRCDGTVGRDGRDAAAHRHRCNK